MEIPWVLMEKENLKMEEENWKRKNNKHVDCYTLLEGDWMV